MYKSAEEFINTIMQRKASDRIGLSHFKRCMEEIGNPQYELKCIHVGGTNGKGSTTNYLRSILQAAGYKVGTFTSPHLIEHNDRIRINDHNISDQELLEYGNKYDSFWQEHKLSMFEIDMFISVDYFLRNNVDFVIYEVGLGGRLDATNIILPLVSVITNIGYDHTEFLGDTYEKIAAEKAGIIKEGKPLFTTEKKKECLEVFQSFCTRLHSPLVQVIPEGYEMKSTGIEFTYKNQSYCLDTLAKYQVNNATLAVSVIQYLKESKQIMITEEQIKTGLDTQWKGRFEIVQNNPTVIIDGAHNEAGVQALVDSIKNLPKPRCIVFTALRDKEYHKMVQLLLENCEELIVTEFDFYRAQSAEKIAGDFPVTIKKDFIEAIQYAKQKYSNGTVIITGSLYFISDVRELLVKGEI